MSERAASLLAWYAQHRRDLPWRRTKNPWAVWVSEIMLQQTRVDAVRERFESFVVKYGEPRAFAAATDDEVLVAWRGLGYYRRARSLRDAARIVVAEHEGQVPRDSTALRNLPGIGEYTQGAIGSIAFDLPLPAIDGNVERLLSRTLWIEIDPKSRDARDRMRDEIRTLHTSAHVSSPGDVNQALMELGAMICTPRAPKCAQCPWMLFCEAHERGRVEELPRTSGRSKATAVETEVLVARREDTVLMQRVPPGEINAGQYCLPTLGIPIRREDDLEQSVRRSLGVHVRIGKRTASFKHAITKWRLTVHVREALDPPPPDAIAADVDARYGSPRNDDVPATTIVRKALRVLDRR
ncbi:MAG: A/G-specific adenine glycosylase [Planctomycetes bacterium]|nr:A/G-specific adenine glycosylase [Planctomycetota bacterium]MCB9891878.1 A/G-specific adenine glycosylase [Planctomycetota bacterium]MCB9919861.1 A/G-specific adenine glycosylase [Planctomycetota bacterium]